MKRTNKLRRTPTQIINCAQTQNEKTYTHEDLYINGNGEVRFRTLGEEL